MIGLCLSLAVSPSTIASTSPTRYTQYPWVTTQHDSSRTSYTLSPAPKTNHLLWKADLFSYDSAWWPSVVVANGIAITPLISSVGGFDAITGEKLWETELPHYHFDDRMSGFTVDSGGKLWVSDGNYTYVLDALNGDLLTEFDQSPYQRSTWTREGRIGRSGSPTVVGTTTYVSTREGTLYALTYNYGQISVKWTFQDQWPQNDDIGMMLGSPIVVGNTIYQTSADDHLYAINKNTGLQIWNFTATGISYSFLYGATYVNGKLYLGTYDSNFYCVNATTGSVIWQKMWNGTWCGPAAAYGKLYIGSGIGGIWQNNTLFALDQNTGATVWNYSYAPWGPSKLVPSFGLFAYGAPSVADGMVFQIAEGWGGPCYLFAFNATTGQLIWKSNDLGTSGGYSINPTIADGRVYVKNGGGGTLYCFGMGPTSTVASVSAASLYLGNSTTVSGNLLDQSPASPNAPIAGEQVVLSYSKDGGTMTSLATVTTDSQGGYSYVWTPADKGSYDLYASFAGTDSYMPSNQSLRVLVNSVPPPYPTFPEYGTSGFPTYPTFPEYGTSDFPAYPTMPTVPSASDVAEEVVGQMQPYPDYTLMLTVIAATIVIAIIIGVFNTWTIRKMSRK